MQKAIQPFFVFLVLCITAFSQIQAQNSDSQTPSFGAAPVSTTVGTDPVSFVDASPTTIARGVNNTGATTAIFGKFALGTPAGFSNINATFNGASFAGAMGPDGFFYCIDNGPPVNLYKVDTATGVKTLIAPVTGVFGAEGWTELAYDKSTATWYASSGTGVAPAASSLYTFNITTGVATRIGTINAGLIITIAINPLTNTMYGVDISTDQLLSIDKTTGAGTVIGPIGYNSNYGAGSAFDELGVYYFSGINVDLSNARNLYTLNLTTGASTLVGSFPPTAQVSSFGIPVSAPPPPSGGDSTLVMFHDTTVTSGLAKRLADRDSTMKYLSTMISKYKTFYFNASTTLPDLSNYKSIILVETSYDNSGALVLGASARTSIKDWLAAGTPTNKKTLISVGGDQGYNYDRTGGSGIDTVFSRTYGGFIYKVDNAVDPATSSSIIGVAADAGNTRTIADPTTGFYADGCTPTNGATVLYRYAPHTAADTVAGVSRNTSGYITVTSFVDPRYLTENNVKPWLLALISYAKTNGGTITSVTPLISSVADKYSLSQNYPNPFNPTTKINFAIPQNGFVSLKVYDISGKEVMTLVNKNMTVGSYAVDFNGAFLSSGVYFYRLETGSFVETKKMMLVK